METHRYEIALALLQLAGLMARAAVALAADDVETAVAAINQCAEEFVRVNRQLMVQ